MPTSSSTGSNYLTGVLVGAAALGLFASGPFADGAWCQGTPKRTVLYGEDTVKKAMERAKDPKLRAEFDEKRRSLKESIDNSEEWDGAVLQSLFSLASSYMGLGGAPYGLDEDKYHETVAIAMENFAENEVKVLFLRFQSPRFRTGRRTSEDTMELLDLCRTVLRLGSDGMIDSTMGTPGGSSAYASASLRRSLQKSATKTLKIRTLANGFEDAFTIQQLHRTLNEIADNEEIVLWAQNELDEALYKVEEELFDPLQADLFVSRPGKAFVP